MALALAGLVAYGGLGVGVATGVIAGVIFRRATASRVGTPNEWSGSLPPGVPPPPRSNRRAVPERPSVTEWDGVVAAAPAGPPGGDRPRPALPTADRLAAALEKSRSAGSPTSSPPPVVVLPPPPQGLRGVRTVSPPASTSLPSTPPSARPRASYASAEQPSPAVPLRGRRWQPETGELKPWEPHTGPAAPPLPPPSASARSPPPPSPAAVLPAPTTPSPPTPPAPAPTVPANRPSAGSARMAGPLRQPLHRPMASPSGSPTSASWPGPPAPVAAPAAAVPAPAPPPAAARPALPRPTQPLLPPSIAPPPTAAPPLPGERPPPPSGPSPRARSRAWKCPNCGLVNAPWSPRCTRCQAAAPAQP